MITTLEKRVEKSENRLDKIEDLILQLTLDVHELRESVTELRISGHESGKRIEQGFAELRASSEETEKRMAEDSTKLKKSHKQLNKQLGELSRRLGTIVEDLVAPSLERIFFEVTGLPTTTETVVNVRIKKRHITTRKIQEFDAIVESEKYLLVNETKSQLQPEHIPKFLSVLEKFYDYFPDDKNKGFKIIGAMSSTHLSESLINALSKRGLLALAISDNITELKNPAGFNWKTF